MAVNLGGGSFYNRFKNPYSYTVKKPDTETVDRIMKAMQGRYQASLDIDKKRSLLDRTFDALLLPNYAIAGAINGGIRDDQTFGQGLLDGVKAGNPFGKGFEQGETTFSDVIRTSGINPTGTLGKAAVGTTGFVLDVLLDPTTYLSGGVSALVKGTGRLGSATKALETLAKTLPPELLNETGKITHMTDDMAKHIVSEYSDISKMSSAQLGQEVTSLKKKYNDLIGIRDVDSKGVTFGLGNVPFGDKLANKLGVRSTVQLSDGSALRGIGDSLGLAKTYQMSRNAFYGSRIGAQLSRNAGLKQLAEVSPAKLYEYIGSISAIQGKNLDKFARDKEIKDLSRTLLSLDPAVQKKIIEALETPTIWNKVKDTFKLGQTEAGRNLKHKYLAESANIDEQVKGIRAMRDELTDMSEDQLHYARMLTKNIEDNSDLTAIQRSEVQKLSDEIAKLTSDKSTRDYGSEIAKLESELSTTEMRYKKMYETEGETIVPSKFSEMPDEEVSSYFNTHLKSLEDLNKEHKSLKKLEESAEDGKDYVAEQVRLSADRRKLQSDLRHDVSTLLFGRADYLPADTSTRAMDEIIRLLNVKDVDGYDAVVQKLSALMGKEGYDDFLQEIHSSGLQTALRNLIDGNDAILNDTLKIMHTYLGSKYGYSDIMALYSRSKELQAIPRGKLAPNESIELSNLLETIAKRNEDVEKLKVMNSDELRAYIKQEKDLALKEDIYKTIYEEEDALKIYGDATDELSDTTKRAPYYGTMDEAGTITRHEAEVAHMQKSKSKSKLTDAQREADAVTIRDDILHSRARYNFNQRATPESKSLAKELSDIKRSLKSIKSESKGRKLTQREKDEALALRYQMESVQSKLANTNYDAALRQSKELTSGQVKFVQTQEAITTALNKEMFPFHKYSDLTTPQKNMLTTMSYYKTKDFIGESKGAIPTPDDVKGMVKQIIEASKKNIEERVLKENEQLLSNIVDTGTGVKVMQGDEIVEGVITQKIPDKVNKSRTSMDVHYKTNGEPEFYQATETKEYWGKDKDGKRVKKTKKVIVDKVRTPKPRRVETFDKTSYSENTGIYSFQVALRGGDVITVEAKDIVGTFIDKKHYETVTLPAYSADELARVQDEMKTIKNRIKGLKGVSTKEAKRYAQVDADIAELTARKGESEEALKALEKVEADLEKEISAMSDNYSDLTTRSDAENAKIDKLVARKESILSKLDDDDAFEILVKQDYGEEFLKTTMNKANWDDSKKVALDNMGYETFVVDFVKTLRKEFNDAGIAEIGIGKLKGKQFDAMMEQYFPRSLSEEGKIFFEANPTLAQKYNVVSTDFGFGGEWNPYAKSRSIEGQSLHAINDFFQTEHGVRIFEENLGVAYINRMLKHTDLMYDAQVMDDLMYKFGHMYDGTKMKGYDTVINFGHLRKEVASIASDIFKLDIQDVEKAGVEITDGVKKQIYEAALVKASSDLGFDMTILNGHTTPMIKPTPGQLAKMMEQNPTIIRQMNNMTIDKVNQTKQLIMAREENRMLQVYDKFLTFIKLNQTTVSPAFTIRNKLGNIFQGYLGVGTDVFNPKFHADALKAARSYDDFEALSKIRPVTPVNPGDKTYRWDEIMDLAGAYRVVDEGFISKDFSASSYSGGTGMIPGKLDPFNTKEFMPYQIGGKVNTTLDNSDRLLQFASLLRQGKTADEAAETVRKYLFDYGDLTTFEKTWMKRIFPYYTWMRKNTPLMLREVVEQPEKFALVAKAEGILQNGIAPEDRVDRSLLPQFAQDWVQMPFNLNGAQEGQQNPVMGTVQLPYMDIGKVPNPFDLAGTARNYFSQSTPLLKVPIELATNWNSFFDEPIAKEGEGVVTPRLLHVMSQFYAFNAAKGVLAASNGDTALLNGVNALTGVRMTSFDMQMAKKSAYEKAYEERYEQGLQDLIGEKAIMFGSGILDYAKSSASSIGFKLVGSPYSAFEADGALTPISKERFAELSPDEQQKYSLSDEDRFYMNNRALELQEQSYKEAGAFKKFTWTVLESLDERRDMEKSIVSINKVRDGDTFDTVYQGESRGFRLLLIDTPESVKQGVAVQPMSKEASNYSKDLLLGKDVRIYVDGTDKYGRLLGFVEVDGKDVGQTMIQEGLGKVGYTDQTNYTNQVKKYYNEEEDAFNQGKGIWSIPGYAEPGKDTGFKMR